MVAATSSGDLVELDWDVIFEDIGYDPHPGQLKIHQSGARNRVLAAGRRFGKSRIGGVELYPECLATYNLRHYLEDVGQRREFWIVGPEYSDSEKEFRVLWDILKRAQVPMDRPGSYNNPLTGDLHISTFGGKFQVHGKSAKHPETLVGEGLSGVILAEAAKLKERVWTKFLRPTLADFEGWALFSSTPEGKNWFYKLHQQGADPLYKEWASFRMPSWYNPNVYKSPTNAHHVKKAQALLARPNEHTEAMLRQLVIDPEIMSLILDLTPEAFNQEIAADFTEFVGRVFKEFDEDIHVGDFPFEPGWETYAAVDYGFTNPFVWLLVQVGPWGDIRVIGEYYQRGITITEAASELQRRGLVPANLLTFYPDPALPGETRELEGLLKVNATGGTGGELNARLEAIRKALKMRPEHLPDDHPEKRPQLMIDRRCVETIREFNDYRYPKSVEEAAMSDSNLPEHPMKKDDHTPEALGRFFAGRYGSRSSTRRRGTRVRGSSIG
jgi:hypothetical protein